MNKVIPIVIVVILIISGIAGYYYFLKEDDDKKRENDGDRWHKILIIFISNETNQTVNGTITLFDDENNIIYNESFSIKQINDITHKKTFEINLSKGIYSVNIYIDVKRNIKENIEKTKYHTTYGYIIREETIDKPILYCFTQMRLFDPLIK